MIQVRENNENIIFQCEDELNINDVENVKRFIKEQEKKPIVINLKGVSSVKNSTLNVLKEIAEQNKLSLCSMDADIFAAINLLKYDSFFHIFPNEESVFEDKYELKNRRFKVV